MQKRIKNEQKIKILILFMIIVICIEVGAIAFFALYQKKDDKYVRGAGADDVTRYEWMQMLCERVGMTEYENEAPYFVDVEEDDLCFQYIQSATEIISILSSLRVEERE